MSYNASLAAIVGLATSMRASEVGGFNSRWRSESDALFVVSDPTALIRIASYLIVDEESLRHLYALMTPGIVQMNLLRGHSLLASVALIHSGFLRWPAGGPDARLANPNALVTSLVQCGWRNALLSDLRNWATLGRAKMVTTTNSAADEFIDKLSVQMFTQSFSQQWADRRAVPNPLRTVLLVLDFDTEFQMQGILGFLENSTGEYLPETIDAFREIGAIRTSEVVSSIAQILVESVDHNRLRRKVASSSEYQISSFASRHRGTAVTTERAVDAATALYVVERPIDALRAFVDAHLSELSRLVG